MKNKKIIITYFICLSISILGFAGCANADIKKNNIKSESITACKGDNHSYNSENTKEDNRIPVLYKTCEGKNYFYFLLVNSQLKIHECNKLLFKYNDCQFPIDIDNDFYNKNNHSDSSKININYKHETCIKSNKEGNDTNHIFLERGYYDYKSEFKKKFTLNTNKNNVLTLENNSGSVEISKGEGKNIQVETYITILNNDKEYAESISDSIIEVKDLKIISNIFDDLCGYNNFYKKKKIVGITVDYSIKIPKGVSVNIDNRYGDVDL